MRHEAFKEWLVLHHYRELDPIREVQLREHLENCASCRKHQDELRQVLDLADLARIEPDASLLDEARRELGTLFAEVQPPRTSPVWSLAAHWPVAASLFVGLTLGFLLFGNGRTPALETQSSSGYGVRNLRIQDSALADGQIAVNLDQVRPIQLTGNPGDPRIQQVMAEALRTNPNPGERIRAALALESSNAPLTEVVRAALIQTLKSDPNIGVRRRALGLLQGSAFLPDVQRAFVEVLLDDANPGLRIAAITALARVRGESGQLAPDLAEKLLRRADQEENDFIRLQSKAYLQEVRFQ